MKKHLLYEGVNPDLTKSLLGKKVVQIGNQLILNDEQINKFAIKLYYWQDFGEAYMHEVSTEEAVAWTTPVAKAYLEMAKYDDDLRKNIIEFLNTGHPKLSDEKFNKMKGLLEEADLKGQEMMSKIIGL